ncbi:MAG TPA: hypothetical protein VGX76_24265, partial [Pirellulales bacterium]|nr:hypothetical protein [Pirellulales bacterium]
MRLKHAILLELGRDELKRIVDELELAGVDRRSIDEMRDALSRSRRATPALLLGHLGEAEVKSVCENVGANATGRRQQLVERLLATETDGDKMAVGGQAVRIADEVSEWGTEVREEGAEYKEQGTGDSEKTAGRDAPDGAEQPQRRRRSESMATNPSADSYQHPESTVLLRPDVGTQAQFKKRKPRATYRYDSSLSPALDWDGQNPARELGEQAIADIVAASDELAAIDAEMEQTEGQGNGEVKHAIAALQARIAAAAQRLKQLGRPFLNWAGKAERLSFDVPTLPLFVHERLSTKAIVETLTGHKRSKTSQLDLFGDPEHPIIDQVLKPYEFQDRWTNRMILGDSLAVMNSLLHYEKLGGHVQMIYMDPPYGVRFGSNFQPFVRKRDVKHGDDEDMTREPEMVQAYRNTWEIGLHSYLTYLR